LAYFHTFLRCSKNSQLFANRGTAAYKGSRMVKKQQPTPTGDRFEELAQTAQEEKKQHAKEAKKASVSK
jgi:hypothetical protein